MEEQILIIPRHLLHLMMVRVYFETNQFEEVPKTLYYILEFIFRVVVQTATKASLSILYQWSILRRFFN